MSSSRLSSPPVVQLSKTKAEELISRIAFPTSRKGKGRAVVNAETRDGSEEELVRNERLEEALEACREESLLLEGQLRRAVEELESTLKNEGAMSEAEKRIALLEYEIAYLETSIASSRTDYPPSSDPLLTPSKEIVIEEVERGIARTVRELKTVLEWEERNAVKEGNKLSRDQVLLADAEELHKALKRRVRQAQRADDELAAEDIIEKAQAKATMITETFSELMGALIAFIDQRLARVNERTSQEDAPSGNGSSKGTQGSSGIQNFFHSSGSDAMDTDESVAKALILKQLLENLMNNAVTSPMDPWVGIENRPRELVDFLVRAGVVSEHPKDGRRIRLVEFGKRVGE